MKRVFAGLVVVAVVGGISASSASAEILKGNLTGTVTGVSGTASSYGTVTNMSAYYLSTLSIVFSIDTDLAPTPIYEGQYTSNFYALQNPNWLSASVTVEGLDRSFTFDPSDQSTFSTSNQLFVRNLSDVPGGYDEYQVLVQQRGTTYFEPETNIDQAVSGEAKLNFKMYSTVDDYLNSSDLDQTFEVERSPLQSDYIHGTGQLTWDLYALDRDRGTGGFTEVSDDDFTISFLVESLLVGTEHAVYLSENEQTILAEDEGGGGGLTVSLNDGDGNNDGGDVFTATYTELEAENVDLEEFAFDGFNFLLPGDTLQLWELDYSGELGEGDLVELIFSFDPIGLSQEELDLIDIYHFVNGEWLALGGEVDLVGYTITAYVDSFSPFALGTTGSAGPATGVPEPATLTLFGAGLAGLGWLRLRRKTPA